MTYMFYISVKPRVSRDSTKQKKFEMQNKVLFTPLFF